VSDADLDGPEWIDPAAGHHRDLTALTAAVRGELDRAVRRVNATLVKWHPLPAWVLINWAGRGPVRAHKRSPGDQGAVAEWRPGARLARCGQRLACHA
jgi:hypothetical protein